MKWQASQSSDLRLPDGLKIPAGTIWSIDSDSEFPSSVSVECQSVKVQTNLSYQQYFEMCGEDNHIWKVRQKVNGSSTNLSEPLNTNIGDEWIIVDLGSKVVATPMLKVVVGMKRKTRKIQIGEPISLSYHKYTELFGEDKHITKKVAIEKRFGL